MPRFEYLEKCADYTSDIRNSDLMDVQIGPVIGHGKSAVTYQLGEVPIPGKDAIHVALKLKNGYATGVLSKTLRELSQIDFIMEHVPELEELLPEFIALVHDDSEAYNPIAQLTEDASEGGAHTVESRPVLPGTHRLLAEGLQQFGTPQDILDEDELRGTAGFLVGNRERLLDFTPSLVINVPEIETHTKRAMLCIEAGWFDLVVPRDSSLAASIHSYV